MNLEPNKNQAKLRKKVPTSTHPYLPSSHNLVGSTSTSISKEKLLENIKKITLHQNNFANVSQLTNRSNINSKSKSSSRIPKKKIFEKSNPPLNKKTITECFASSNPSQQYLPKKYIGTAQQAIVSNSVKINTKQTKKINPSTKIIQQISSVADVNNIFYLYIFFYSPDK